MGRKMAWRFVVIVSIVVVAGCLCEPCSQDRRNEETVRMALAAIMSGDLDSIDRYFTDDYVRHCQATPEIAHANLDQFKAFLAADREAVPDQTVETIHLFAQKDLVAFWGVYRGTQRGEMGPFPATGRPFELDFAGVHRLAGGKIVETWVTWDNLDMLMQLGPYPPEAPAEPELPE